MEFKIITDLSALPQIIETNAEELKTWLTEKMEHYNALVVTPDTIRAARDDKAALNKLRSALEERRKEVKRQCMAPYEAFEQKYKELLALIDAPIASIDSQVKSFEEQELQEKYKKIRLYFDEITKDIDFRIDLDRVVDPKWRNKTNSIEKICRKLFDDVERIKADRRELVEYYTGSPHYTAIMDCYMQGYDKACALAYAAALIQQEQRQRALQPPVSEPEARARAEQVSPNAPQTAQRSADITQYPEDVPLPEQVPPAPDQPRITGMFRVTGTKSQIIALRDFMRQNQIQFEVVKQ